ncbi:response regulator [Azohydromonas australica]|uniref:response regulator n=1 Tax=Azohydromonas australica TaxID=364039 RepID=UPI00040B740D|nr:response regulator [Azohydromonas australica]
MDFSELFTESARQVRLLAHAKGLVSFFDYRGPNIDLGIDRDLMRSAMHRLLLVLMESIAHGFVTLSAEAAVADTDRWLVTVTAAGTGAFAPDDTLACVLQRHGIRGVDVAGPDMHAQWQEPLATQPAIDVALSLHKARGETVAITWQATLPARLIDEPAPAQADGAPAWLVTDVPGGLGSVDYRLRRQGWHVRLLPSLHAAQSLLDEGSPAGPPMLLMVAESAPTTLADLERLRQLSPATWLVLAVLNGSPALRARGATPVDIRVLPLSRAEIDALARHVDPRLSTARSRQTSPVPQYGQAMRRVLAVDDNPFNQLVVRGLLELLGCEVEIAADGQQAIACCRAQPPDLVLMDVHMPGMDGLEATRQLRALQRQGVVPPFPIVAATAMHPVQGRQDCLAAGMDGYLDKPLDVQVLNDEMHRVLPMQPQLQDGNPKR